MRLIWCHEWRRLTGDKLEVAAALDCFCVAERIAVRAAESEGESFRASDFRDDESLRSAVGREEEVGRIGDSSPRVDCVEDSE